MSRWLLAFGILAAGLFWLGGCGMAGLGYNNGWYLGAVPFGFAFLFALTWAQDGWESER